MKMFLLHLSIITAMIAFVIALATAGAPSALAQQADQDPAPASPRRAAPANGQQQHANEAQMPASGETTTEEAKTFNGRIVKENGEVILKDPVTKVTYKLDDSTKARQYMGKQVKVTGKLDMNSNTIRVESIEPMS